VKTAAPAPVSVEAPVITPRRILMWGLAAGWIILLVASYSFYSGDFRRNFGMMTAPAGERALFESGDIPFYDLLSRAPAYTPGEYLLILSADNLGQYEFLSYRAAYQLYPVKPLYVPLSSMPPTAARFSWMPEPALLAALGEKGVTDAVLKNATIAALFVRPDPARNAYYRVSHDKSGKMTLTRLPLLPAPALPPGPALWKWLAGLGLMVLLGAGFVCLSGLNRGTAAELGTVVALFIFTGAGITAWLMIMLGIFRIPFSIPRVLGCWIAVWAIAAVRWRIIRQPVVSQPGGAVQPVAAETAVVPTGMDRLDRVGMGLAIFGFCWALLAVAVPMSAWGNWDTWAIWNLKARACWLAGGIPFSMLGEPIYRFSHHDYPLGLPMLHSWLATWAGGMDERLLRLLSPFYLFTLFFLVSGLLRELGLDRGRWLLAAALMTIPKTIQQGYSGYADLPVACGMAAGMLVLARSYRGEQLGWAAGLFGGLAALHKDEGLIWGGTSILLLAVWAHRGRVKWAQVAAAGLILVVLVGPWKMTAARMGLRPNDYKVQPGKMIADAPERIPLVVQGVLLETLGPGVSMNGLAGLETPPGEWWIHLRGAWFLLWYAVLLWVVLGHRGWRRNPVLAWLALLPVVQVSAYTAVYTASVAASLPWHITTSLDRLLLQVAPAVYVLAAAACFGPVPELPVRESAQKKGKPVQTNRG